MSPSLLLHGCQQQRELSRASLPALVPRVEQQSQGNICSLTALEELGRSSQVSTELGGGGCSHGALQWAQGETGTAARSAAGGIAHEHQAASLSAESALTGAARAGKALPSSPSWYFPWVYHLGKAGQE